MKEKLRQFMLGRYGQDNLNKFISISSLVFMVISMITGWTILYSFALVLLVLCTFRMFSRNTRKRSQENLAYFQVRGKISRWFSNLKNRLKQRKTHCFYKCPSCHTNLRVPKGRGNISITCPKCKISFKKRT